MTQILLFRDPCPLVERLGLDFFRQLPERPGVYLMRGPADALLYVGKAKNLRKRLCSYRVANPDRMPRRHLRLLRAVERIEIQECADESAALRREAELLRAHKPKFNRAGTWPGTPKFLAWKTTDAALHLTVTTAPETDWRFHGPLGAGAFHLRAAMVRLLWLAFCPECGLSEMPAGWFRGNLAATVTLQFPKESADFSSELSGKMDNLLAGRSDDFGSWILTKASATLPLFEQTVFAADIEYLTDSFDLVPRTAVI